MVQRLSYDAWGKRRYPNGADDVTGSIASETTRGFTGEEELSIGGLVHLNGRVYDPLLARMTSADPTVTDSMNPQGWNRYSYVGNDPLAFTDPNGYSWLSNFFHSVANALGSIPILRSIVQIAVTAILSQIPFIGPIVAAAAGAAIVNGLSGGNLGTMLRSAAMAASTAFAFNIVGGATNAFAGAYPGLNGAHGIPTFGSEADAVNIAGHALVGCGSSIAAGGSCGSGALAGALPSFAGSALRGQSFEVRLVANTVLGGTGSVIGGGKFANGAITGVFGCLYNELARAGGERTFEDVKADAIRDPTSPWLEGAVALTGGGKFIRSLLSVFGKGDSGAQSLEGNCSYDPRVRQRALEDPVSHNFPYSYDPEILSTNPIPRPNGYNLYQKPGSIGKTDGVFEIGVRSDGVIDHRFFRSN
ncbi:MAG: RHS repeat-associated core domain-containing protein [Afipia sp.]